MLEIGGVDNYRAFVFNAVSGGRFGMMRQMAGPADQIIVQIRRHADRPSAHRLPKILHGANGVGRRLRARRDQANGILKQIGAGRGQSGFFRTRHGMTADKMSLARRG